jgi:hypothetical protein
MLGSAEELEVSFQLWGWLRSGRARSLLETGSAAPSVERTKCT